jgi:molecular chaperone DnaK (HSP70)
VPANSHSTQRFVTLEAFRRAGFVVRAVLNEPSAAGLEYAHRHPSTLNSRREHVVVYDLGGGTFDAALVLLAEGRHEVLTTSGVARLGGDDFDQALLEMALAAVDVAEADIDPVQRASLLDECRAAKEALHPNSRRIALDLAALGARAPKAAVVLDVAAYYERSRPLVEQTLQALEPVLGAEGSSREAEVAGIYVVGGASGLPVVPRTLRERFGRRVHRSPHPSGATAIGLAIAAASDESQPVGERFTRHLGVFRERERGARISFDGLVSKDTPMPLGAHRIAVVRRYRAAHNLGHFRFVECGALDAEGDPSGDITPHAEVLFPFSPALRQRDRLDDVAVERLHGGSGPLIEERYEVDAAGIVAVTITDLEAGFAKSYVL